jgi:hypothetical protein
MRICVDLRFNPLTRTAIGIEKFPYVVFEAPEPYERRLDIVFYLFRRLEPGDAIPLRFAVPWPCGPRKRAIALLGADLAAKTQGALKQFLYFT